MGRGPHLCFLHGFCENKTIWDDLIAHLKDQYTCISIDLPGFGLSTDVEFKNIPFVVKQLKSLFTEIGVAQPILIGHSMGGYIVAEFLSQYRDEVKAAAFIHSTARADSEAKKDGRDRIIEFIQRNGGAKFFPSFVDGLVSEANREVLNKELLALVGGTPDSSIISALQAMKQRPDHVAALQNFKKPVLFVMGAEDQHYTEGEIYLQASKCDLVQINKLEDVGHLSMFENKKKCLNSIKHFLDFVELTS